MEREEGMRDTKNIRALLLIDADDAGVEIVFERLGDEMAVRIIPNGENASIALLREFGEVVACLLGYEEGFKRGFALGRKA